MTKFPIIQRISDKCLKLEPFKLAHPHRQIDCPNELKENQQMKEFKDAEETNTYHMISYSRETIK